MKLGLDGRQAGGAHAAVGVLDPHQHVGQRARRAGRLQSAALPARESQLTRPYSMKAPPACIVVGWPTMWQESGNRGSMPSRKVPSAGTFQVIRKTFAAISRSSRKPGRTSCALRTVQRQQQRREQTEQQEDAFHGDRRRRSLHDDLVAGQESLILCRLRGGAALGEPLALHGRPHLLEWRQLRPVRRQSPGPGATHRPIAADRPNARRRTAPSPVRSRRRTVRRPDRAAFG